MADGVGVVLSGEDDLPAVEIHRLVSEGFSEVIGQSNLILCHLDGACRKWFDDLRQVPRDKLDHSCWGSDCHRLFGFHHLASDTAELSLCFGYGDCFD